jgi:hypothetical protein
VKWARQWLENHPSFNFDEIISAKNYSLKDINGAVSFRSHSFQKISMELSSISEDFRKRERDTIGIMKELSPSEKQMIEFPPKCGGIWKHRQLLRNCRIWGMNGVYHTSSCYWKCSKGCCKLYYDGRDQGIFNSSNQHLFTHTLLFRYLYSAVTDGTSFTNFAIALNMEYKRFYNCLDRLDSRQLSAAFLSFVSLLEENESDCWTCTLCGKFPKVMCFDGTDLGIPKKWTKGQDGYSLPPLRSNTLNNSQNISVPWKRRILFGSSNHQKTVRKLGSKAISESEFKIMMKYLEKKDRVSFEFFENLFTLVGTLQQLPKVWIELFQILGSRNSLTRLFRPTHGVILDKVINGSPFRGKEEEEFLRYSPVLYNIFVSFPDGIMPSWCRPFFQKLKEVVLRPFIEGELIDDNTMSVENIQNLSGEKEGIVWQAWQYEPQRKVLWYSDVDMTGKEKQK